MGFKEDIDKLISIKKAAQTEEEEVLLAEKERLRLDELARTTQLATQAAQQYKVDTANQIFNAEVFSRIFTPPLLELQAALNSRRVLNTSPWKVQTLSGNEVIQHGYWNETGYDNPYEWCPTGSTEYSYLGVAATRITDKIRKRSTHYDEWENTTLYEAIFVGHIGMHGTVLLTTGEKIDTFVFLPRLRSLLSAWAPDSGMTTLHVSKGTELATFDCPTTSPETLNQDLAQIQDPNSKWHTLVKPAIAQGLTASIHHLPDYKIPS